MVWAETVCTSVQLPHTVRWLSIEGNHFGLPSIVRGNESTPEIIWLKVSREGNATDKPLQLSHKRLSIALYLIPLFRLHSIATIPI